MTMMTGFTTQKYGIKYIIRNICFQILAAEFNPHGFKVPTKHAPSPVLKFLAYFSKSARMVLPVLDRVR